MSDIWGILISNPWKEVSMALWVGLLVRMLTNATVDVVVSRMLSSWLSTGQNVDRCHSRHCGEQDAVLMALWTNLVMILVRMLINIMQ